MVDSAELDEADRAFEIPAVHVNGYCIAVSQINVRVTFSDQSAEGYQRRFRYAVSMSIADAETLAFSLGDAISKMKKQAEHGSG